MGRAMTFFVLVWMFTSLGGGIAQGSTEAAATRLASAITVSSSTLNVQSTAGFPSTGILVLGDEHVAYATTTATTFAGLPAQPLVRGAEGTDAAPHVSGSVVRTPEGGMVNTAISYNVAVIADTSGIYAALVWPLAFVKIIVSFLILPIGFLGTNMAVIGYIWLGAVVGLLVSMGIALAGNRRV